GYTVVFVPESKAYYYAKLSPQGSELVSSGLEAGKGDPAALGLVPHLRIAAELARGQTRQKRQGGGSPLQSRGRWSALKTRATAGTREAKVLRYGPTVGNKCGLTLLVDFDDTPGTLSRAAVVDFLNGDNYKINGNNGSVKEYYADVSRGKLIYTN